ncbi:protein sepa-1-like, partial [Mercenaria mercenaria]|uniref:protein sepa-1-like n=1 Tax=Mercenaria mercenaria TaxID=6596 RepID=UPI00234FACCB
DSEGLHEQKRARLDIPSEGPNSTGQNSRTSNQNITNTLLNTDSLLSGNIFRPIFTKTNQGKKEWQNSVTLDLRTHLEEKVVSAIYQFYKEKKVDKLNNIIPYAKTVERHAFETANSREEYYRFLAEKIYEIQTENKQLPGPNTILKGNQMVDSLFTPIFTQTNQGTKQWYKSITLDLRTHIVQKIVSAILPEPSAAELEDKRMKKLIAYAKLVEGDCYETANDKGEYYHFLAERIYKIQTELEYKRNERRKLQKHQLPGDTTDASYHKPETSDDEISSQSSAASASRS